MLVQCVIFLVGLVLIVKGGDLFVSASVRVAEFLRMPRVVIGSTLVSLATTSPEMVVAVMSGFKGESGLAVGNAVGSCVCNVGLILGMMATLKQIELHPKALATPVFAMCLAGLFLFLMTLDLGISRSQGCILLLLGLGYFIFDFRKSMKEKDAGDIAEAVAIEEDIVSGHQWLKTRSGTAVQFIFGAVIVLIGSALLVESAVNLAGALGIPPIVIGLSVIAVGTSLPELVTAISSSRQNVSDLAVGNVIGANVANLTFVVGSAASIREVSMSRVTQLFSFPAMLIGMTLVSLMIMWGKRVTRRQGSGLLAYYGVYLVVLVLLMALGQV